MITQSYKLNLIPNQVPTIVKVSQYDKSSRTLEFTLYDGDTLFTIPTGAIITIVGTKPDKTGYQYSCSFSGSVVSFDLEQQISIVAGKHEAELRINLNGELLGTANFVFDVEKSALSDDTIISDTDLPIIEEIIEHIEPLIAIANDLENIDNASTYANNASASALVSEGYALGTQNGTEVEAGSPYYHNNSKYYAEHGGASDWNDLENKPFETLDNNTLAVNNNVLKVNTTDNAEEDNTLPITSSGVNVIVGNINVLLQEI